jgi:peptidoglycan/xylan/chitin deacetylase (PgdA/CDA1 family)
MKPFFYTSSRFLGFVPINLLIRITGQKIIFPFYHLVSDEDVVHVKHLYHVRKVKEFERDLEFLLRHYRPIGIHDFMQQLEEKKTPVKPCFLLSFDDGLREFHDVVAPILLKKGVPAVCFLNTAFIDNKELFFRYKAGVLIEELMKIAIAGYSIDELKTWCDRKKLVFDPRGKFLLKIEDANRFLPDEFAPLLGVDFREYLDKQQPYLTSRQILSLRKQGFVFGAHSIDHPCYAGLSPDQQVFQTTQSIREISERFNPEYRLFSFPFTDDGVSAGFFETILNAEQPMADLTFGCAGLKRDSINRNIQRIPIEANGFSAKEVIVGEYLYYLFKALLNKNILRRQ